MSWKALLAPAELDAGVTTTLPPRVALLPNGSFSVAVMFADSTPAVELLVADVNATRSAAAALTVKTRAAGLVSDESFASVTL